MTRWLEDVKAGAIGNHDPLEVLRLRISHLTELCDVIATKHTSGTERDVSIRLALQYLRQDLGRSDLQLARLERN